MRDGGGEARGLGGEGAQMWKKYAGNTEETPVLLPKLRCLLTIVDDLSTAL